MAIEWIGPFYSETYENSGNPGMAISARDSNGWPVHLSVEAGANGALLENYYNFLRIKPALWEGSNGFEAHLTSDNLYTANIKATVIDPSTGKVGYTASQTYSFRVLDSSPPGDGETLVDTFIDEGSPTDAALTDTYGRPYVYYKAYGSDGWGDSTFKLVDDAGGRFKLETDGDGTRHLRVADGAKLDFQTYKAAGGERYKIAFEISDGTTTIKKFGYVGLNNVAGSLTGDFSATVAPKGVYTLTATDLGAANAGANPSFVVSNASGGTVVFKGSATPVTSFTGADIAAGKVQFVQSGKGLTASFDVAAKDGYGTTAAKTFSLNVVNQAPKDMLHFGPNGGPTALTYYEESNRGWSLRATDPEGETNTTGLKWSIVGGADAAAFTIGGSGFAGGSLAFKTIHDFEAPTDANRDNKYEVVVRVADSYGAYLDKAWTVSVINLREFVVAEGAATGTLVQGPQTIPVPGFPSPMQYALPKGEDRFTIDRNTGAIKVAAGFKLDFEQANIIHLPVKKDPFAPEAADESHSTPILIKVRDVRDETVRGDGRDNKLVGGAGNDTFFGLGGVDDLNGGNGRNRLDGGTGDDRLLGGLNEDTYVVDSLKDIVLELAGGGRDTIEASISYDLDAQARAKFVVGAIEDLTLLEGRAALKASGNALANTLRGNSNANVLDGKAGADTMAGGRGDDRYYVDTSADLVVEARSAGTDTVYASVSYRLGAGQYIEQLLTTNDAATTALSLSGNEFGNRIKGNAGDNTLNGGLGADTLFGLKGKDTFVFNTALSSANVDHLGDFSAADDTIKLAKSIFTAISTGTLAEGAFKDLSVAGATVDANDRILYDKATGVLSYDADGSGATAAVQFAIIDTKATLTASDFLIVS